MGNQVNQNTFELHNPCLNDVTKFNVDILSHSCLSIRFSTATYDKKLLDKINKLCQKFGGKISIGFYQHFDQVFDARCLAYLPDVENLSVRGLLEIKNHECIHDLRNLKSFEFEVYLLRDADFFSKLHISNLAQLSIGNTKNSKFDLSPLVDCVNLKSLVIDGDKSNLSVIGELDNLSFLFLRCIPKKRSLAFVSELRCLKNLNISLGGRESLNEIDHKGLEILNISLVTGLSDVGDLSRFERLNQISISQQAKLSDIAFSKPQPSLEILSISGCKKFKRVHGFSNLTQLKKLTVNLTAMDPEFAFAVEFPKTLRYIWFTTGKKKLDRNIVERLYDSGRISKEEYVNRSC